MVLRNFESDKFYLKALDIILQRCYVHIKRKDESEAANGSSKNRKRTQNKAVWNRKLYEDSWCVWRKFERMANPEYLEVELRKNRE